MKFVCIFIPFSLLLKTTVSICSASSLQGLAKSESESKEETFDSSKGWVTIETVRAVQNRTEELSCTPKLDSDSCVKHADTIYYNPYSGELGCDFSKTNGLLAILKFFTFSLSTISCTLPVPEVGFNLLGFFICFGFFVDCMCTHGAKGMSCGSREDYIFSIKHWSCIYTEADANFCDIVPCDPWGTCSAKYLPLLYEEYAEDAEFMEELKDWANCAKDILCILFTQFIQVPECNALPDEPFPFPVPGLPMGVLGRTVCTREMIGFHDSECGICLPSTGSIDKCECNECECDHDDPYGGCSLYKNCDKIKYCVGCNKNRPMKHCNKIPKPKP